MKYNPVKFIITSERMQLLEDHFKTKSQEIGRPVDMAFWSFLHANMKAARAQKTSLIIKEIKTLKKGTRK